MNVPIIRTVLVALFVTASLTGGMLSPRLVVLAGFTLPSGALIFPWTFAIAAILCEVYGPFYAFRLVCVTVGCTALMRGVFALSVTLPAAHMGREHSAAFASLYHWNGAAFFGEILGVLVGQSLGLLVFAELRKRWRSQMVVRLWLYPLVASLSTALVALPSTLITGITGVEFSTILVTRLIYGALFATLSVPLAREMVRIMTDEDALRVTEEER